VKTCQQFELSNTTRGPEVSMTIRGPKCKQRGALQQCAETIQPTLLTHKHKNKYTPINRERCQPVLTRPGCNCIKTHDFPRGKYEPSPFVRMCLCMHVPESLNKVGPLHLVPLNSDKGRTKTCRHRPPHSLSGSQRHATVGPECTPSFSKTDRCGP